MGLSGEECLKMTQDGLFTFDNWIVVNLLVKRAETADS